MMLLETKLSSKVKQVESFHPLKPDINDPNCPSHHRSIFNNNDAIYEWRYTFSKVQSWQGNSRQVWKGKYVAGRKENYHHKKFTALWGNLFFNNALAQKKKWGWYHLTFVAKFVYPNFIGQVWSLPCPVCHLIKLLVWCFWDFISDWSVIIVVEDNSLVQACWVGVDFETTVNAGVDDEVWLDTAIIIIFFFLDLF